MLSSTDIRISRDIRYYSGGYLSVLSDEDGETYWFSQQGFPWASRENSSFCKNLGLDPETYTQLSRQQAISLLDAWKKNI